VPFGRGVGEQRGGEKGHHGYRPFATGRSLGNLHVNA